MTNLLKSFYISTYVTLLTVATVHAAINLSDAGAMSAWSGILVAVVPSLLFFVRLFVSPIARTSASMPAMPILAGLGSVLALAMASNAQEQVYALLYALALGVGGSLVYIYWYSKLGRTESEKLALGQTLPAFSLVEANGTRWESSQVLNQASLFIFYRANWCPLCMAQIKEVAERYQELESMGVGVYLVSPQPENQTQSLAKKFKVNYHFMVDDNNQAAKTLGIEAKHGTPKGLEALGYDSDTVLPTVIMTNTDGKIIFSDQTDNYRVRPEPDTFIKVFKENGLTAA